MSTQAQAVTWTTATEADMDGPHGHVVLRPDGMKARCGGPSLCSVCAREAAQEAAASEIIGYKIGEHVYDPADVTIIRRTAAQ